MTEPTESSDLETTLKYLESVLDGSAELLEPYRSLDPKLDLLHRLTILLMGITIDLKDSSNDILTELNSLPDSFSEILKDVNLNVSQKESLVVVTINSLVPETLGQSAQFVDKSFTVALLKAYSYIQQGHLYKQEGEESDDQRS